MFNPHHHHSANLVRLHTTSIDPHSRVVCNISALPCRTPAYIVATGYALTGVQRSARSLSVLYMPAGVLPASPLKIFCSLFARISKYCDRSLSGVLFDGTSKGRRSPLLEIHLAILHRVEERSGAVDHLVKGEVLLYQPVEVELLGSVLQHD